MGIRIAGLALWCAMMIPSPWAWPAAAQPSPGRPAAGRTSERPALPALMASFARLRGDALAWRRDEQFDALLSALDRLPGHGLWPQHYHRDALARHRGDYRLRDRLATEAWFSAATDLLHGRLDPRQFDSDWSASARAADLPHLLERALTDGDAGQALLALAPSHPEYRALSRALSQLLADPAGSVATPVALPASRPLDEEPFLVRLFRDRDASAAPLPASRAPISRVTPGRATQIARLRVNLERWRWLPDQLGARHVRVNLAAYRVDRVENARVLQRHRAIVGDTVTRTPVFSDMIRYIVLNPWWETPHSIAVRDELPVFRAYPGAAREFGFQVLDRQGRVVDLASIDWRQVPANPFPYRLRQAPGPNNALGRAKIMFPNRHDVYLHDTSAPELFLEPERGFSSGCVRTDDIAGLSAWLLETTPGWSRARVQSLMASGRTARVTLAQPVPVHILYFTAEPDGARIDGAIHFHDDIYARDQRLLAALGRAR
ncbi:MAG: L,D-transpeptidase family protein [Burkholderiaceae bacterium]